MSVAPDIQKAPESLEFDDKHITAKVDGTSVRIEWPAFSTTFGRTAFIRVKGGNISRLDLSGSEGPLGFLLVFREWTDPKNIDTIAGIITCIDVNAMRRGMPFKNCLVTFGESGGFIRFAGGSSPPDISDVIPELFGESLKKSVKFTEDEFRILRSYITEATEYFKSVQQESYPLDKLGDFYVECIAFLYVTVPVFVSDTVDYMIKYGHGYSLDMTIESMLDEFVEVYNYNTERAQIYHKMFEGWSVDMTAFKLMGSIYDIETSISEPYFTWIRTGIIRNTDTIMPHRRTADRSTLRHGDQGPGKTKLTEIDKGFEIENFKYPERVRVDFESEKVLSQSLADKFQTLLTFIWNSLKTYLVSSFNARISTGILEWIDTLKLPDVDVLDDAVKRRRRHVRLGTRGGGQMSSTGHLGGFVESGGDDNDNDNDTASTGTLQNHSQRNRLPFEFVPFLDRYDGTDDQLSEDSEFASWFMDGLYGEVQTDTGGVMNNAAQTFNLTVRNHALEPHHTGQFDRLIPDGVKEIYDDDDTANKEDGLKRLARKSVMAMDKTTLLQYLMAIRMFEQTHITRIHFDKTEKINSTSYIINLLFEVPIMTKINEMIFDSLDPADVDPVESAIGLVAKFYGQIINVYGTQVYGGEEDARLRLAFIESSGLLKKINRKVKKFGRSAKRGARRAKHKIDRVVKDTAEGLDPSGDAGGAEEPAPDVAEPEERPEPKGDPVEEPAKDTEQSQGGLWEVSNW